MNIIKTKIVFLTLIFAIYAFEVSLAQTEIRLDSRGNYVEKANEEFENGEWEAGKITVDEGLKKYKLDSDLHMLLGKYYHHKKQLQNARYHLNKALDINPNNVDAKQILVNVEMESERYSSAVCYVNELLEVNPYWRGLWRKKIELYEKMENYEEANRLRRRINQIYPEDTGLRADYLYHSELEAAENRKKGNTSKSIEITRELIQEDPENPKHYLGIINDYLKNGDRYNALSFAERGLYHVPNDKDLINKKVGILAEENRYDELLPFLQEKGLTQQYNYYLLEAARYSRENESEVRYGKIFSANPGNSEAFNYVFNYSVGNLQFEEALYMLNRHRQAIGNSKNLDVKELLVYKRMGNTDKANSLTKELFDKYPNDYDLRYAYVKIMLDEAKLNMKEERYGEAMRSWKEVDKYGDSEMKGIAQHGIYNVYVASGDYTNAIHLLNEMSPKNEEEDFTNHLKKSDLLFKQEKYSQALSDYEYILDNVEDSEREKYLYRYGEMQRQIIKELIEANRFYEAKRNTERWLYYDTSNQSALRYAVNLSHQMNQEEEMYRYAKSGNEKYPDDLFFKLKLAELNGKNEGNYEVVYNELHADLLIYPYQKDLINTFAAHTKNYGLFLIKHHHNRDAVIKIDTALVYSPDDNELRYIKGLAFEKLKQYDSAYYYQSFYVPSEIERTEFNQHLHYLNYKGNKNEIILTHLRSRFADRYTISTLSSFEYNRKEGRNVFAGRVFYAGRDTGKGFQLQGEWFRDWTESTATVINFAWANKFFPKFVFNTSIYHHFENIKEIKDIEFELGVGYRKLDDTLVKPIFIAHNMFNIVLGASLEKNNFRHNIRFNNFWLDKKWLFNITVDERYYLGSPKHYILAMVGVGTSPDVEMVNYQLFDGFSKLNMMIGAGYGRMIYKNVSVGVIGTWYNYRSTVDSYRNLYNLFVNLNVAF